jgi:CheY-like chemotaxis protein
VQKPRILMSQPCPPDPLADDHQIMRQGLRRPGAEQFQVVAEAPTATTRSSRPARLPDVAVLDVSMPRLNGLTRRARSRRVSPGVRTILLTVHTEDAYVMAALRAGIKGYVEEPGLGRSAPPCEVPLGGPSEPGISGCRGCLPVETAAGGPLTVREREVLQLVAEGKTTGKSLRSWGSARRLPIPPTRMMQLDVHGPPALLAPDRRSDRAAVPGEVGSGA